MQLNILVCVIAYPVLNYAVFLILGAVLSFSELIVHFVDY